MVGDRRKCSAISSSPNDHDPWTSPPAEPTDPMLFAVLTITIAANTVDHNLTLHRLLRGRGRVPATRLEE